MNSEIERYNASQSANDEKICCLLMNQINIYDLTLWLNKSVEIQWDYKNIVKRKGVLQRLK